MSKLLAYKVRVYVEVPNFKLTNELVKFFGPVKKFDFQTCLGDNIYVSSQCLELLLATEQISQLSDIVMSYDLEHSTNTMVEIEGVVTLRANGFDLYLNGGGFWK